MVPLLLRAEHSWQVPNDVCAKHYVSGRALGEYDSTAGGFVDRAHVMWLDGFGWAYCRTAQPAPCHDPTRAEAFGVQVLRHGAKRPHANTVPPSARAWFPQQHRRPPQQPPIWK